MEPSFTSDLPDPLISRAIAVRKLKNSTKQYAAIKRRLRGKLRG